jgi:replicative DNA helicase
LSISLPQDLDAEAALLGTLICEPDAIKKVADILRSEHFTSQFNADIYKACLSLYKDNIPIDNVSVAARYDQLGGRQFMGERAVIATLMAASLVTTGSVRHYAENLIELYRRRQAINIHRKSLADLQDLSQSLSPLITTATEQLFALGEQGERSGVTELKQEALPEALRRLETAREGRGDTTALSYPWPAVTALTPLRPGEVTVVCGRPGMAKSSLILNAALYTARKKIPVGIFSLEMNKQSLVLRLISLITGIDSRIIEKGKTTDEEHQLVIKAIEELARLPINVDDTADLDELAFVTKSRAAKQQFKLGLIIIDYLTLMARRKNEDEVTGVGSCARTVRKTARMLEIPILEVCQVSRNCEYREDKRPILADLRASGEIEQEADVVLALYRDEYYHRERSKYPGMCEVIVLKHRNGPLGTTNLYFKNETTRFFALDFSAQNGQ